MQKKIAENMDTVQGYATATTKLASSYAWDTAINFIQIKNSDYGKSSPEGNYLDSPSFTYVDIDGIEFQGPNEEVIITGQTKAVSNIYDMGGNLYEYTTEDNNHNDYVVRGGYYRSEYNSKAAGSRTHTKDSANTNFSYGFRVTLYCAPDK